MTLKLSRSRELLCLIIFVTTCSALAQPSPPSAIPDRYLLVLDFSAPMRPRAAAVQEAVTSLLVSGMRGQIKEGDQIGIWTFNDQLHSGEFELMEWSEIRRNDLTRAVLEFVKSQTYEKETRFEQVRPELMAVVQESKRITVILISDGDEVIQGTPFDLMIRRYFQENAAKLKELKVPAITVLRGYNGRFVGHTISYPPWPLEFPPFPAEPDPIQDRPADTKTTATQPNDLSPTLVKTNTGPIVFAEPLIVSGKDSPNQPGSITSVRTNAAESSAIISDVSATNLSIGEGDQEEALFQQEPELDGVPSATNLKEPALESNAATGIVEQGGAAFWGLVLWVGLGLFGLLAAGGVLLLRRKPGSKGRTSLITRSMDDEDLKR